MRISVGKLKSLISEALDPSSYQKVADQIENAFDDAGIDLSFPTHAAEKIDPRNIVLKFPKDQAEGAYDVLAELFGEPRRIGTYAKPDSTTYDWQVQSGKVVHDVYVEFSRGRILVSIHYDQFGGSR